ncbi:hypothetical protein [Acetobacterium paludosum]|uniref:hypothetical protein n=1 Tax=Acetobacterium paludosum TaxID=52693 RepID=UPI00164C715A|nr:hypothetical protein [Acetobacterium paludosum]
MARQARVKSATGIYHVILKGLDGRNIFLDDADRSFFMEKLNKARETGGSIRQLSRVLGLGKMMVEQALKR